MNIPNDPMMLLSFINTKLRDDYKDFSTLCYELELDESAVTDKLASIDYSYNRELTRFVQKWGVIHTPKLFQTGKSSFCYPIPPHCLLS